MFIKNISLGGWVWVDTVFLNETQNSELKPWCKRQMFATLVLLRKVVFSPVQKYESKFIWVNLGIHY